MVALKADKNASPEVDELLKELGNAATAIPYYAVFSPGLDEPIHFFELPLTADRVEQEVQKGLDAASIAATNSAESEASQVASRSGEESEF